MVVNSSTGSFSPPLSRTGRQTKTCKHLRYTELAAQCLTHMTMTTTGTTMARRKDSIIPPSLAWLTVFVPALSYFLATRFHATHGRSSYPIVTAQVDSLLLDNVFYVAENKELQHCLQLIEEESLQDVVSSIWKHDSELGRGYLLLSSSHESGRIWRWERGGGPIPIGKTLHIEAAGNRYRDCSDSHCGSGGLAIDFHGKEHFSEGRLVVAEWGEGRIARLEEKTGARTPLVMNIPDPCEGAKETRVKNPLHMLYTPLGHFLFVESSTNCSAIMQLNHAVHVPPLATAMESRMAHKWNKTHHSHSTEIVYKQPIIASMALDATGTGLYATIQHDDGNILLVRLALENDDDNEEDEKVGSSIQADQGLLASTARVVFNFSDAGIKNVPRAMTVDGHGHVFVAAPTGILVIKDGDVLGTLAGPTPITSLTLGEDRYLYVTTSSQLLRVRVKHGPAKLPTNRVKKVPTSTRKH